MADDTYVGLCEHGVEQGMGWHAVGGDILSLHMAPAGWKSMGPYNAVLGARACHRQHFYLACHTEITYKSNGPIGSVLYVVIPMLPR